MRIHVLPLLLAGFMVSPAHATDCPQQNAIYGDGGNFRLSFSTEKLSVSDFNLKLVHLPSQKRYHGDINLEQDRRFPIVRFGLECTGTKIGELECSEWIYDGVAYVLGQNTAKPSLPAIGSQAVETMLFPELVLSFSAYQNDDRQGNLPNEIFRLINCRK